MEFLITAGIGFIVLATVLLCAWLSREKCKHNWKEFHSYDGPHTWNGLFKCDECGKFKKIRL